MNMQEIENTIVELENGDTTFDACIKLSALYNVKEHFVTDEVEEELDDILPSYRIYCETKKEYQLGNTSKEQLSKSVDNVCDEIYEFFLILYRNAEYETDRTKLLCILTRLMCELE